MSWDHRKEAGIRAFATNKPRPIDPVKAQFYDWAKLAVCKGWTTVPALLERRAWHGEPWKGSERV